MMRQVNTYECQFPSTNISKFESEGEMISYETEMFEDSMIVRMESTKAANRELAEYINWANWTKSAIQQEIRQVMGKPSSETKGSYGHHSILSHPSISSISSADDDIIKITLRGTPNTIEVLIQILE
jgi:hypothetical protein